MAKKLDDDLEMIDLSDLVSSDEENIHKKNVKHPSARKPGKKHWP